MSVEGVVPLFVHIGDLRVWAWFGIVEMLVVDALLGTSFIDQYIHGIFPTERKFVPWSSKPMEIILSAISSINANSTVIEVNTSSENDGLSD